MWPEWNICDNSNESKLGAFINLCQSQPMDIKIFKQFALLYESPQYLRKLYRNINNYNIAHKSMFGSALATSFRADNLYGYERVISCTFAMFILNQPRSTRPKGGSSARYIDAREQKAPPSGACTNTKRAFEPPKKTFIIQKYLGAWINYTCIKWARTLNARGGQRALLVVWVESGWY